MMILRSVVLASVIVIYSLGSWASKVDFTRNVSFNNNLPHSERKATEDSLLLKKISSDNHNGKIDIDIPQPSKNSPEVDLNLGDAVEGREKKDDMLIPLIFGGFGSATISVVVAVMKMVVLKALFVAKIALTLTILLLIGKLMDKGHVTPHVEVEQYDASEVYPVYTEYSGGGGYSENLDGGTYGDIYSGYHGGAAAESVLNYATVAIPGVNTTLTGVDSPQPMPISRRHYARRKAKVPMILTIRQYTKPS